MWPRKALKFTQAAEYYGRLFNGTPDEAHSQIKGGVWRLCDKRGNLLALVYPDGSTISGRTAAALSG